MTATLPTTTKPDPTPCPAWCEQLYGCEWNEYGDHGYRFHEKKVSDTEVKDQLVTFGGPVDLYVGAVISAEERVDVDWDDDAPALRHRMGEPTILLSIGSRGPAGADGKLPNWDESMHHLSLAHVMKVIDLLTATVAAHKAATGR